MTDDHDAGKRVAMEDGRRRRERRAIGRRYEARVLVAESSTSRESTLATGAQPERSASVVATATRGRHHASR